MLASFLNIPCFFIFLKARFFYSLGELIAALSSSSFWWHCCMCFVQEDCIFMQNGQGLLGLISGTSVWVSSTIKSGFTSQSIRSNNFSVTVKSGRLPRSSIMMLPAVCRDCTIFVAIAYTIPGFYISKVYFHLSHSWIIPNLSICLNTKV